MKRADWLSNPHAHMVELDFVVGRFVTQEEGDGYRQMWCGFGLGVLLPEKRVGDVILRENESLTYQTALRHSVYRFHKWWNPFYSIPQAVHGARRAAAQMLHAHAPDLFNLLKARRSRNA